MRATVDKLTLGYVGKKSNNQSSQSIKNLLILTKDGGGKPKDEGLQKRL